jgi:hypothetical protein
MSALVWTLKATGALAMLTGGADIFKGPDKLLKSVGQPLLVRGLPSAALDSQFRFLAACWVGWGATVWWASNDVRARKAPIAIAMATFALGGVGRVGAAMRNGWGSTLMVVFTAMEFVLPPVVFWLGELWTLTE